MAGPNRFTRRAGVAGLISSFLTVGGLGGSTDELLLVVALACFAFFFAGLVARHRALWWSRPAAVVLGLALALFLVSLTGDTRGAREVLVVAGWIGALTMGAVLLGVLLAGELPRPATFLVLVTQPLAREGPSELALVTLMASAVGYAWLAWTMWREPQTDSREDLLPRGTMPEASGST